MQNLTPLDIQKQQFQRSFRGYHVDEIRAYLHLVAEEVERLLKETERLTLENGALREEMSDYSERERILKDTLLSAQKVSEEMRLNARKEADMIVKDAEIRADRLMNHAMVRVGELERSIQDLKIERKAARNKLQSILETFQQLLLLDAEQEASDLPITQIHRKASEAL
jgi:cell division initiation protein